MMNEIILTLRFKEYEFRRAKAIGSGGVIYTTTNWIGKNVSLIPVPYDVTDKMIEKHRNHDGTIEISMPSTHIINKEIKDGTNVGRAYIPKDYIGYDFLIIETPPINYI